MIEEQIPLHHDKRTPQDVAGDGISMEEENPMPQGYDQAGLDYVGGREGRRTLRTVDSDSLSTGMR